MTEALRGEFLLDIEIVRTSLFESLRGLTRPIVKGRKPTDRETAIIGLLDAEGDYKRQLSELEAEIKLSTADPTSLRGKIGSLRTTIVNSLNKRLPNIIDGYNKDWFGPYQLLMKEIDTTVDKDASVQEFITEGIYTREEIVTNLRTKAHASISNLQKGGTVSAKSLVAGL